jgi:intein/homing endonuclease
MISVTMEWHLWKNEEGTYAICRVHDHTNGQTATAKGDIAHIKVGSHARLHGRWEYEPKKGWSFRAEWADTVPTEGLDAINAWQSDLGLAWDSVLISKVAHMYGTAEDALHKLREEPYHLARIGTFEDAEKLAAALGLNEDDPRRLHAGAQLILTEQEGEGHTYTTYDRLLPLVRERLYLPALESLEPNNKFYVEEDRWYRKSAYELESRVGDGVLRILAHPQRDGAVEVPKGDFPLTNEQEQGVLAAHRDPFSIITGGPGVGKCISPRTRVLVDGNLMKAEEIWDLYNDPGTYYYDGEGCWSDTLIPLQTSSLLHGSISEQQITKLYKQYVDEKMLRIFLNDGTILETTKEHKLLTLDNNWTNNLSVGMRIALPRVLPHQTNNLDKDLVKILAWQISEGCEQSSRKDRKRSADVSISQKDEAVLEELRCCLQRLTEKEQVHINSLNIRLDSRTGCNELIFYSIGYRNYLESLGYVWGLKSAEKIIPEIIMKASREDVRVFLSEYFSAEGHVEHCSVSITSASESLIQQLKILLRRYGVWLRVRKVLKRATNGSSEKKLYYTAMISGSSLRIFHDEIGFSQSSKQAKLLTIVSKKVNDNIDLIPAGDLIKQVRDLTELSRRELGLPSSSYFSGSKDCQVKVATTFSNRLGEIINGDAERGLMERANNKYTEHNRRLYEQVDQTALREIKNTLDSRIADPLIYAQIIKIEEYKYEGYVYDFEVAGPHNYIAEGALVHNTATLKTLVDSLEEEGQSVLLVAPTGKAAKRMSESTERSAKTLHSALDWQYVQGLKDNPGPLEYDVVVVDESSMMDLELADKLFSRIEEGTRVVLVGDVDQLPAVGQGNVFHDLIDSGKVPTTRLTKTFRQGAGSLLLTNAQRVRDGKEPYWNKESAEKDLGPVLDDFTYLPARSPDHTAKSVLKYADQNPDTMVIAPTRHGRCGVHRLNKDFQNHRNLGAPVLIENEVYSIRKGDRVLVTKNDRKLGVVNGDLGELVGVSAGMAILKIDGNDDLVHMEIPKAEDTLELGYVLTIHKSQGSQASQVVCPLEDGSADHMLNRNLIYTAWTRGQKKCTVIGPRAAIKNALPRQGTDRNTDLARYIRERA